MESNNIFNTTRLALYLNRHIVLNYKNTLIGLGAISGVISIVGFLTSINGQGVDATVFKILFYVTFAIAGSVISSLVFNEMDSTEKAVNYMTLPVSTLERLVGAWLYSSILFTLISFVFFYFSYYLSSTFAHFAFNSPIVSVNIFEPNYLKMMAIHLMAQPIYLLGAALFKGYCFLKTILSLFLLQVFIGIFTLVCGLIILGPNFQGSFSSNNISLEVADFFENFFVPIANVVYYLIPPFFLVVTYFTLKERDI